MNHIDTAIRSTPLSSFVVDGWDAMACRVQSDLIQTSSAHLDRNCESFDFVVCAASPFGRVPQDRWGWVVGNVSGVDFPNRRDGIGLDWIDVDWEHGTNPNTVNQRAFRCDIKVDVMAVAAAKATAIKAQTAAKSTPRRAVDRVVVPPTTRRVQNGLLAAALAASIALQPSAAEAGVQLQKVDRKKVLQDEKRAPKEKKEKPAKKVSSGSSLSAPSLSSAAPLLGGLLFVSVGAAAFTVIPKIDLSGGGDIGAFLNEAMAKDVSGYVGNEVALKEGGALTKGRASAKTKKGRKTLFGK